MMLANALWPRGHANTVWQRVQAQPSIYAASIEAQVPCDLACLQASGPQLMDRSKQLQIVLPSLPGHFCLLLSNTGVSSDLSCFVCAVGVGVPRHRQKQHDVSNHKDDGVYH